MPFAKKAYRIQISAATAFALFVLGSVSLVASFYLGMVTGQTMRPLPVGDEAPGQTSLQSRKLLNDELEFFNLSEKPNDPLDINLPDLQKLQETTRQLAEEQTKIQETLNSSDSAIPKKTDTRTTTSNQNKKNLAKPTKETVVSEQMAVPAKTKELNFTVQVFSSKLRKNSENILSQLRRHGFSKSYIYTYISANNEVLYRVRVGKTTKADAEQRAFQLKKLDFIESAQITRI